MKRFIALRYFLALWLPLRVGNVTAQTDSPSPSARLAVNLSSAPDLAWTVVAAADGARLRVSPAGLEVRIPLSSPGSLDVEHVRLTASADAFIAHLASGSQHAAVLLARRGTERPRVLWTGRLDFRGDPGERSADAIEVRSGSAGSSGVVVGTYAEQLRVCGEARTLLAPRAVDPETLRLRSIVRNRDRIQSSPLMASAAAPADLKPPPLFRALYATSASRFLVGHEPATLVDAELTSGWIAGSDHSGGAPAFVTLGWSAPGQAIRALSLTLLGAPHKPAQQHAPIRLALLGPHGEKHSIALPSDAQPGQRYWITPETPWPWECLTLMLDDASAHTGLAELEVYTPTDGEGGLAALIAALDRPGAAGDDATSALQHTAADYSGDLSAAWTTFTALGKRRALRAVFSSAQTQSRSHDHEILRRALTDRDTEISEAAFAIASSPAQRGASILDELAREPTRQGDRAAKIIGHSGVHDAFDRLLRLLSEQGGDGRPALREALAAAYPTREANLPSALAPWLDLRRTSPLMAARAALCLALCEVPAARGVVQQLLTQLIPSATEFSDRFRLVQAAEHLPITADTDPEQSRNIDVWLADLSVSAEPWMLREAALRALARRNPEAAEVSAHAAQSDAAPRVRALAARVLVRSVEQPSELAEVRQRVQHDEWFSVRQAPLEELPDSELSRAWLLDALNDPVPAVRLSAISGLSRLSAISAWPAIAEHVSDARESPEVAAQGIRFARALCAQAAVPTLQQVAQRATRPDATHADKERTAQALESLLHLGGQAAAWARTHPLDPTEERSLQLSAADASEPACQPPGEAQH